ncbi:MAG: siroheme synthase CysG [Gammaproteobacteria bacterium]
MDFLPVNLDLKGKPVLVVGGGAIALRKAELLARAQAVVQVVAPEIRAELVALADGSGGGAIRGRYDGAQLAGKLLVVAATDDNTVNAQVSRDAQARGVLVNVVDQPALCTFIFPAIVDRSPVIISVSSGGAAPVLARLVRARIETLIPAAYGRLAALAARFRVPVKEKLHSGDARRRFWESVLSGTVAERVFAGQDAQADALLVRALDAAARREDNPVGEVYLVGGGPGDPDLLTFRALRLMQQADVVLYDRLVSPGVLDLVRRDAEKIYVGKKRDDHAVPQEGINALLVRLAQEGKRVCRLKGGDPFIFGRGGEEIEDLVDAGIPFQVVPGITAAAGCAAYAGIPLTHRAHSQSVRFVTAHMKTGKPELDWKNLAAANETLCFYMGLVTLPVLCTELVRAGMPATMPVALVERGTTPEHRVHIGTLATIESVIAGRDVHAPTMIIVGTVVTLHEKLAWYRPEAG